jgi:hypothetical protein
MKKKPTVTKPEEGKVFIDMAFTVNMGNFNSVKIGGGMTVPVNATPELMNECLKTWQEGKELLEARLLKEVEKIKS